MERVFLETAVRKLRQLASRIQDCLGRLSYDEVWTRGGDNENAVGNLVLHLAGNVRQWIGTGVAGMPDIRVRDREFAARGDVQPQELWQRLNTVVEEAAGIIANLPEERLVERVTIQAYTVTVLEAVFHVVEHFAQHTGQIIFATKLLTNQDLGYYKHLSQRHTEKTP